MGWPHMVDETFKTWPPKATEGTNLGNKRKPKLMQTQLRSLPQRYEVSCFVILSCPVLRQAKPLPSLISSVTNSACSWLTK